MKIKIVVDRREKNSLVVAELISGGAEIELQQLKLADYLISPHIAIERKTIDDFIGSMLNKRLLKQLIDLKENYAKPLLIIEGIDEEDLYSLRPGLHSNAIRGMILAIVIDFGIPIIFTKDAEDTATFLILLAKRQARPEREVSLKVKRRAFSLAEQQQFIVESLPGIGPALAKQLLKKFKTIKAIAAASTAQLASIKKLGAKKAEIVKKILQSRYRLK